ncbi:MAG TPA: CBS domain-containing protein [Anaeromyxobacteraceae bacterium]
MTCSSRSLARGQTQAARPIGRRRERTMRVDEVMSEAKCCHESDPVRDVARLMREESIGFVPICNEAGEPIGAVTDRDLAIRVLADARPAEEKVERFMSRDVVSCRLGADVTEAERLMRDERKSRVMVIDEQGRLRGVISLADIADAQSDETAGRTLQDVKSDQPTAH